MANGKSTASKVPVKVGSKGESSSTALSPWFEDFGSLWPASLFPRLTRLEHLLDDMNLATRNFKQASGLAVSEDNKNFNVEANVAGFSPEQISVSVDNGMLWVSANKAEEKNDKNRKYYRKSSNSVSYQCALPRNLKSDAHPEATLKNGILSIQLPKDGKDTSKTIPVKVAK